MIAQKDHTAFSCVWL